MTDPDIKIPTPCFECYTLYDEWKARKKEAVKKAPQGGSRSECASTPVSAT
jgi:hypothetical protein